MSTRRDRSLGVSPELAARVLDFLIQEADMDGLVTTTQNEIGEGASCSQTAAGNALHALEADGRVSVLRNGGGRIGGRGGSGFYTAEIQLAESVLAET